eukprot:2733206-Amphidinium_carterae.1
MVLHKCDTTLQAADIFTKSFTDINKWRHALSLIHFGVSIGDHIYVPSVVRPPQPSLPKQKEGGAPVACCCCCRPLHVSEDNDCWIRLAERLFGDCYFREEQSNPSAVRPAHSNRVDRLTDLTETPVRDCGRQVKMAAGNRDYLFGHEDGYYLKVEHPDTNPGKDGALRRAIIDSDDCFLPERNDDNPLETLVPTRREWEKISHALRQDQLNMRLFCSTVQKYVRYMEHDRVLEAQVWVGAELPDYDRDLRIQEFTQIYIVDTESQAEREEKALRLYRKVIRFVKAMIIASSEVSIPPYVMHGWKKPSGMASDVCGNTTDGCKHCMPTAW